MRTRGGSNSRGSGGTPPLHSSDLPRSPLPAAGAAVENAAKGASTASIERRGSDERTAELKRAADGAPPSSPSPKRTASGAAAAAPASPGEKAVHQPERRVILTTHPLQYSSSPMAINWGAADPQRRGPVVATLHAPRSRNAMGTHNGPYAVYRAVSVRWNAARFGSRPKPHAPDPTPHTPACPPSVQVAKKQLDPSKPPDLSHTEPAVQIGPYPAWSGTPRNSARNSARNFRADR